MKVAGNIVARGIVIAASVVMLAAPTLAQTQSAGAPGQFSAQAQQLPPQQYGVQPEQPRRKKHHSGVAAGIAAGVLGGIAGAAIVGGQGGPPPDQGYGYAPPPPPPPGPRYGAYDADDDEPDCRVIRKPVYDEDGEVVSYKTRRVCR